MSPGNILFCCDPLTLESEIGFQRISSKFEGINGLVRILEVKDRQSKIFPYWDNVTVTLASLTTTSVDVPRSRIWTIFDSIKQKVFIY